MRNSFIYWMSPEFRPNQTKKEEDMQNLTDEKYDINFFQTYLKGLYANNHEQSQEYMYGYISRSVGYLCKAVDTKRQTTKDFIRPISWIYALSTKLGIDVLDAFVGRYPGACPLCLGSQCVCLRTKKQPGKYIPAYELQKELFWKKQAIINSQINKPGTLTLQYCVNSLNAIYPHNEIIWHYAGGWYQFSKLQEEVAELHEAIASYTKKKKPKEAVMVEIADVLAWIIGLWGVTMPGIDLDKEFISYYINGCPVCGGNPCTCGDYNSRPEGHVDMHTVIEIRDKLKEFSDNYPKEKEALDEMIKSLTAAAESNDDSVARLSVKQTAGKLKSIQEGVANVDEIGKKTFSIIDTALKLIDKIPWS